MTTALEGGKGSVSRPSHSLTLGKTWYACTGGWVGPGTGLDRCGKSRTPPGFNPRTAQPVTSHYTDWATQPTYWRVWSLKCPLWTAHPLRCSQQNPSKCLEPLIWPYGTVSLPKRLESPSHQLPWKTVLIGVWVTFIKYLIPRVC
jgi:hypothetical protein